MQTPVVKTEKRPDFTTLAGFTVGEDVQVTDWDLGRSESMATIVRNGVAVPMRVSYVDRSLQYVAFSPDKLEPQELSFVTVGSLNVSLGLKLMNDDTITRTYKVVSIGTWLKFGEIRDLCGKAAITARMGISAKDFLNMVRKTPGCIYKDQYDTGGNGLLDSVYFPEDKISVGFSDQELGSVTVYWRKEEVK